jgi:integrase
MGRPRTPFPPQPKTDEAGKVRVWWNGRWWHLGTADDAKSWSAEYARLCALWAIDPHALPSHSGEYLVAELCRDYLASADSPRPGLGRDRVKLAIKLLLEVHRETTVDEFGPRALRSWQAWLCKLKSLKPSSKGSPRFNITTVNYHVDSIRRVWRWGVASERVLADQAAALATVPRPKFGDTRPPRVVEPADPAHVRAALPFMLPPVRAMVALQCATGARPGELCGLRAGDVQRGGKLHVPGAGVQDLDALKVWAYVPPKHKLTWRGKPRYLLFAGESQKILEPFLRRPATEYCFSPAEAMEWLRAEQRATAAKLREKKGVKTGGSRKVKVEVPRRSFKAKYGKDAYAKAIRTACQRAGVPSFPPYALRHLAAAEVKGLFDLDAVQALLGHHTKAMAEHYGGAAFGKAAEVARARGA